MNREIVTTSLIVLSRHPYRESSLIAVGISPDYGKLQLVVNGAMRLSETGYPIVDLFRELNVEFTEHGKSPLRNAGHVELATAFDQLAENQINYRLAGKMGAFLLDNLTDDLAMPYTYDCFKSVLCNLSGKAVPGEAWTPMQCSVVFKTAFLYESGLLPSGDDPRSSTFLENIVASGVDNSMLPQCPDEYWGRLNDWLSKLIDINGLRKR